MKSSPFKQKSLLAALLCGLLLGTANGAWAHDEDEAKPSAEPEIRAVQTAEVEIRTNTETANPHLPKLTLTPQILYQTLLAEIAAQRGNLGLAASASIDLAQKTRDPRLAKRATEFSLYARNSESAVNMARLWAETDPSSAPALQMLSGLLLSFQRPQEALPHLAHLITLEGPNKAGAGLINVQRLLLRYPDKKIALQLLETLTAAHDQLPEAHFALAQMAANTGDETRALQEIDRSLALRQDYELSILLKAQLLIRTDSTQAEDLLRQFITAHPQASDARLAYARLLIGNKHYPEAHREFAQLLHDQPDNPDILYTIGLLSLQLRELDAAEKHLKHLLEVGYHESNLVRYYLGQIAEDSQRPEEALRWYRSITPSEQYLSARGRTAQLLAKFGQITEARTVLQQAATLMPQQQTALLIAESQLLANANRHGEAFELLKAQLKNKPEQIELLYETALLAEKLGQHELMEKYLRKIMQNKPEYAHAYNALGYSFTERGLRLDEAQQLIDRGLELAPEDPFILDSKGWLLFRRGQHESALTTLRKAFALRDDPEIAAHIGEVLWSMGRREEALKTWQDAIKEHPDNPLLVNVVKKFQP